jgi:dissimilatory sulfite reductase (desulfoviridin) alpha/beta subunit
MGSDLDVEVSVNTEKKDSSPVYKKYTEEEIKAKENELNELKKTLEDKKYLLSNDKYLAKKMLNWLETEVSWSYTECIGVVKLYEEIKSIITDKEEKFFMSMGAITAMNYLFQKTSGKGYKSAREIIDMIQIIVEVLNTSIKKDSDDVRKLEFELSSMIEGIQPYTETENNEIENSKTK